MDDDKTVGGRADDERTEIGSADASAAHVTDGPRLTRAQAVDLVRARVGSTIPRRKTSRRGPIIALVVVLVVALIAAALWIFAGRESAGSVINGASWAGSDKRAQVLVPNAAIEIDMSAPLDSVRIDGEVMRAPLTGSLLGVRWRPGYREVRGLVGVVVAGMAETKLTIVTGGERYPLPTTIRPTADSPEGSAVVAVSGDASDAVVEVDFAGAVQTVRMDSGQIEPGPAAMLYQRRSMSGGCPQTIRSAKSDNLTWSVQCAGPTAEALPYVDEFGWAKPGQRWLLTSTAVLTAVEDPQWAPSPGGEPTARYGDPTAVPAGELTVNGQRSVKHWANEQESKPGQWISQHEIFSAPADPAQPLTVKLLAVFNHDRLTPESDAKGAPATASVTVETTFPISVN